MSHTYFPRRCQQCEMQWKNLKERNENLLEGEKCDQSNHIWKNPANLIVQLLEICVGCYYFSFSVRMLTFIYCGVIMFLFCLAGPAKVISPQPNLQQDKFPLGCNNGTFLARQVEVCDSDSEDTEGSI